MVISVISPHCTGNGNTTTAILLALGLGYMRKKVLLTHTDNISESLYTYLGLHTLEDKTSTPTQLVKLLRDGALEGDAIPDYCTNLTDNTYVFTNNKTNFEEDDMQALCSYIIEHSDFDYIVFDFNDEFTETSKYVLEHSDVVVLNFTPSVLEIDKFKKDMVKFSKMYAGKKVVLVCNKYSSIICKDKDIPKRLGVKAPCNIIHYNNYIVKMSNNGSFLTLVQKARMKIPEVIEISNDMNRLATVISKIRIASLKRSQEEKKEQLSRRNKPIDSENGEDGGAVDA